MTIEGAYIQLSAPFEIAGLLPQLPKSPLRLSRLLESTDSSAIEIEPDALEEMVCEAIKQTVLHCPASAA